MTARREFLTRQLPAAFAFAAQPGTPSAAILTDTRALLAGEIHVPIPNGGAMPAYRASPARGRNFAFLLVVEEIFGLHAYIQDICRRLAKLGYCAIAPDLFFRQGDVTRMASAEEILSRVVSRVPDAQVMSDLDATIAWAQAHGRIHSGRIGITGFGWGGRIVWLYAAHQPKLKAGVAWYGALARQPMDLQPKQPIDVAAELKAPVLGLYAGKDSSIPPHAVESMRAALRLGGSGSEIAVYANAPHGFHADYRESYRQPDAEDAWARMLAWLKKHGVA